MDNYKAENQEQEIDLVSLFFAVAHRYKQMAAAAVICAVLFGALGSVKGMLNQRAIDEAIANGEEVPRTSAEQQYEEDMIEYREAQTKHDTDVTSYKQQLNQNEADQVRPVRHRQCTGVYRQVGAPEARPVQCLYLGDPLLYHHRL